MAQIRMYMANKKNVYGGFGRIRFFLSRRIRSFRKHWVGVDRSGRWVSGVRWVAQGGGAESSCVESPEPSLFRAADLDSQTGLDRGGYNTHLQLLK